MNEKKEAVAQLSGASMAAPEPRHETQASLTDQVERDVCVFCQFATESIRDSQKVYEDDNVLALLDDFPISDGHTLVMLKDHHDDLASLSEEQAAYLGGVVARISRALKEACDVPYIYVASLGEQVRHVHYHLVPRYEEDRKGFGHFLKPRGELRNHEALIERIREEIKSVFDRQR
jgi:histidine triad (HIT) family protein